ncbi:MAG: nucleotidyltransferase family protein [Clostridia bacterium]|nr:nucleotidyltransferase family protein [Clostridia bacterium]
MKILAIICEFNPFHNGHKYLIEQAKLKSGCDKVLCIMSGNFTQRGEMCIFDKYTRARHAILGGADCVIQLPSPFAVAPAEIFAAGAVKILSSIPEIKTLAFGSESGDTESFKVAANFLIDESNKFKRVLEEKLKNGESYIKSYASAFEECGGDSTIVQNPNNILGLEYTKSLLRLRSDIDILPIKRTGASYNDCSLCDNFSSASAIRKNLGNKQVEGNVPPYVFSDLKFATHMQGYDNYLKHCLFMTGADELRQVYGCSEGLENKLKSLENCDIDTIVEGATSKRYSSSRVRRILCANALNCRQADTEKFLQSDLYLKILAVKKYCADGILSTLSQSTYPLLTGVDDSTLTPTAKQCFERDKYELKLYNHINNLKIKDYMILV